MNRKTLTSKTTYEKIKWESIALTENFDVHTLTPTAMTIMQNIIKHSLSNQMKQPIKPQRKSVKVNKDTTSNNLDFLLNQSEIKQERRDLTHQFNSSKIGIERDSLHLDSDLLINQSSPPRQVKSQTHVKHEPIDSKTKEESDRITHLTTDSPFTQKFIQRKSQFSHSAVLNEHIPIEKSLSLNQSISLLEGQQLEGYRYMYEKITDKGNFTSQIRKKVIKPCNPSNGSL